ncbi:MAG: hypothetical protein GY787_10135 [Alteromonadales bacterium]|nr:hypothetical protein [Alteromonadales bacterium]
MECPKCKSKGVQEVAPFSFSLSQCFDCGYEYYLTLWYRLGVHIVIWTFGLMFLCFKYIINPNFTDELFIFPLLGLFLISPFVYWGMAYYKFRDIPAEVGVSKSHKILFLFLSVVTFTPALIIVIVNRA